MKRRPIYYVLRNRTPVPVHNPLEWARAFETGDRRVALDVIEQPDADPVTVSTVFIGVDHNWSPKGPPLVFESLVFGGPLEGHMYRYSTWEKAAAGHKILTDEAVVEGKVAAWEVRELIAALAAQSKGKTKRCTRTNTRPKPTSSSDHWPPDWQIAPRQTGVSTKKTQS